MGLLDDFIKELEKPSVISLVDIPEIDLYMDQVIQLFENKFKDGKRHEEEKILTKTMINNYAKSKLFFPIKNKKYSKEHLLLISMIYQLKGTLSINDIKETFQELNEMIVEEESFALDEFYLHYMELNKANTESLKEQLMDRENAVNSVMEGMDSDRKEYIRKVLLATTLVNSSNIYRRAAEKLVDQIIKEHPGEKETK